VFEDANLRTAVERSLNKKNPTPSDMLELRDLGYRWSPESNISNLKGLEYAKNLQMFYLESCSIQDYSVLAEFNKLNSLGLDSCGVTDLSAIASAIEKIPSLEFISLRNNPLNTDAYKTVLPKLRNMNRVKVVMISFRNIQLAVPSIVFATLLIIGLIIIYRRWDRSVWVSELLMGLVSAGVGCYLGIGSQFLYISGSELSFFGNGYENPMWVGGVIGGVFGFLTGVWFMQFLKGLLNKGKTKFRIVGWGILCGLVLGVLCSTIVHLILMVTYRNSQFNPMLIGLMFGIVGGLITGFFISVIFIAVYKMGFIKIKE